MEIPIEITKKKNKKTNVTLKSNYLIQNKCQSGSLIPITLL